MVSKITYRQTEFDNTLDRMLMREKQNGNQSASISASELHKQVEASKGIVARVPGDKRMPMACSAMRKRMRLKDKIIYEPPKGDGPRFEVCYYF